MRSHLFMALLISTFLYIIVVLYGLVNRSPLGEIFSMSITVFTSFFILIFLFLFTLEKMSGNKEDELKDSEESKENENGEENKEEKDVNTQKKTSANDLEDDFTPLNPPVLQFQKKEQ